MFTAKIIEVVKDDLGLSAQYMVEFDKDGQFFSKVPFRISDPDSVKRIVQNQINSYEKISAINPTTLIGDVDLSTPVVTPLELTSEQLALQKYGAKRFELITAKQDLDLGIIQQADYDVILQETIKLKP